MKAFGNRLFKLRQQKGKTVQQVAKNIGISIQAWTDYEKGRSYPLVEKLIMIAKYFNVPIDYLLFGNKHEYDFYSQNDFYQGYYDSLLHMLKNNVISINLNDSTQGYISININDEHIKMFLLSYLKLKNAMSESFSNEEICDMCNVFKEKFSKH